jgi:hypothetical protein
MGLQGRDALAYGLGREAAREQLHGLERAALLRDGELRLGAREARAGQLQRARASGETGHGSAALGGGAIVSGTGGGGVSRRLGWAA